MSVLMMVLVSVASASNPLLLTVNVQDPGGAPVTTASIRVGDEADTHRVHAETGRWTSDGRLLPDGTQQPFEKASSVELEVEAPGYEPVRVVYVFRKKKNEVVVRMTEVGRDDDAR